MKFTFDQAEERGWNGLKLWVYNTKEQFAGASAAYFEVTGEHGLTKSTVSDRVYYVLEGAGEFEIADEVVPVKATDVVIVPRNTRYNYRVTDGAVLKLFLVHTPAFDAAGEVSDSENL